MGFSGRASFFGQVLVFTAVPFNFIVCLVGAAFPPSCMHAPRLAGVVLSGRFTSRRPHHLVHCVLPARLRPCLYCSRYAAVGWLRRSALL
jgi:hypothetical protein